MSSTWNFLHHEWRTIQHSTSPLIFHGTVGSENRVKLKAGCSISPYLQRYCVCTWYSIHTIYDATYGIMWYWYLLWYLGLLCLFSRECNEYNARSCRAQLYDMTYVLWFCEPNCQVSNIGRLLNDGIHLAYAHKQMSHRFCTFMRIILVVALFSRQILLSWYGSSTAQN